MRALVIDNYDSFTYNLVQYLGELGAEVVVVRNDQSSVDELLARKFDRVIVSPGPCTPNEAGITLEVVRRFPHAGIPPLGVCLGHQALAQAFGGEVIRHLPVHGKTGTIEHDGRTIFTGLRYGLTHAWNALVAVELLASAEGLGYLLVWGRQMFWLDTMMGAMLIIGAVGFALDRIMATLEARLQQWRLA